MDEVFGKANVAALEPVAQDELARRLRTGQVLVLDVRPEAEYAAGHIPGAVSVPRDQLAVRLAELPAGTDIVAYCRGRYCVFAPTRYVCCGRAAFPPGRSTGGCPAGGWPGCRSPPQPGCRDRGVEVAAGLAAAEGHAETSL